jgi:hypothetical protein
MGIAKARDRVPPANGEVVQTSGREGAHHIRDVGDPELEGCLLGIGHGAIDIDELLAVRD